MARVLVVDNEVDIRDLHAAWLRKAGHQVLAVDSGTAALQAVDRDGMPQVAVLDAGMPGMDGVQLLSALHQRDPSLPAVFVSVLWSAADLERIRATGAVVLSKPASSDALRDVVRLLLPEPSPTPGGTP